MISQNRTYLQSLALVATWMLYSTMALATSTGDGTVRNVSTTDNWVDDIYPPGTNDWHWEEDELLSAWSPVADYYISWDDEYLYLGKLTDHSYTINTSEAHRRENEQPFVFFIHAEYPGATFDNTSIAYESHQHDFSQMGGINFSYYMRDTRDETYWPTFGDGGYHEFRSYHNGWSGPNAVDFPPYYGHGPVDGVDRSHMEIHIPWNSITSGSGKPTYFRIFMEQYRLDPYSGQACHPDHFITNESPWGDGDDVNDQGIGDPNDGVNDGDGATVTTANGVQCNNKTSPITRWWGCYPVISGISPRDYNGEPVNSDGGPDIDICEATSTNLDAPRDGGVWTLISKPSGAADPVIDDPNQRNTLVSGLESGTYEFAYTMDPGGCVTFLPDTITVTNATSEAASVVVDTIYVCDDFTTLQAVEFIGGTTYWEAVTSGNLTDASLYNTTVTGLAVGANTFVWNVETPACGDTDDTLIVMRYAEPNAEAGVDIELCDVGQATLGGNNPLSIQNTATGLWERDPSNPTTVIFESFTDFDSDISNLQAGRYGFTWIVSNGTCVADSDTVYIDVGAVPAVFAGQDQTTCEDTSFVLGADPVIGLLDSGYWSVISGGPVLVDDINDPNSSIEVAGAGRHELGWNIASGACPVQTDTVVIMVYQQPTADAGPGAELCEQQFLMIGGNDPGDFGDSASGYWQFIKGDANFNDSTYFGAILSDIDRDTLRLVWTIENGLCPVAQDTVTYVNYAEPDIDAGQDQSLFDATSTQLDGTLLDSVQSSAVGTWSIVAEDNTGSSFVAPGQGNTFVTGLTAGAYVYQWKVSNGVCDADSDQVSINVYRSPYADAGQDIGVCDDTQVQLAGNNPQDIDAFTTGQWDQISGSAINIVDPADYQTMVTGLDTGVYSLTWTITNLDSAVVDTMDIIVSLPVTATVQADTGVCDGSEVVISGNNPFDIQSTVTGLWTQTDGPELVIIKDNFLDTTGLEGLNTPGVYTFRWTVSNGSCPSAFDELTVSVLESESAIAPADFALCDQDTVTLNGGGSTLANPTWTVVNSPALIKLPDNDTVEVENLTIGTHQLVYTLTDDFCPASSDTVTITVDQAPSTASAMGDVDICETSELEIFAQTPSVGTGQWSVLSGAGIDNDTLTITDLINMQTGLITVFWTVTNGICEPSVDTVMVNNVATPTLSLTRFVSLEEGKNFTPLISSDTDLDVLWSPADNLSQIDTLRPVILVEDDITYYIDFTDEYGCAGSDSLVIDVNKRIDPVTGFTPSLGGDDDNDKWVIESLDTYPQSIVKVYNRWGNELFVSDRGYPEPWDGTFNGKLLPFGTYYYVIDLGTGADPMKGTIYLIR